MLSTNKLFSVTRSGINIIRWIAINSASVNEVDTNVELKSLKDIPGPPSYPIIGQLLHLLPGRELGDLKTFQQVMYKKYGPIVRLDAFLGQPTMVFLFDPEACAMILRNENKLPIRPGFKSLEYFRKHYKNTESNDKPTGLITDHGEPWKQFRTTVNPVMLQPKTIKLYSSALEEVSNDMIKRMRSKRNSNNIIDAKFDEEMNLWALESIAVVALGGRLGCLDTDLPEDSPAKKLIQCVHDFFHVANELDFKPNLGRIFATPLFKKAMKLYEEQENLAKHFIKEAMEELKTKPKHSEEQKGVLEKLLEIDENTAVVMANDMLFAGVDTSATTVTAALYLLANNPEKQEKLREEVMSGGDKKTYLKAVIKETLRVMPVVGGNLRVATKEYNILGYRIPVGTSMIFCHQYLSTMEEQYPRAKEFIPERWIDKESPLYYSSAHPFSYNPFGFGVRSCIGRRIAELEIETLITKLVENFKIEWFGDKTINVEPASINYITGPYNFTFKDV